MLTEEIKKVFLTKYSSFGNDKFYKFLINYAVNRIVSNQELKEEDYNSDLTILSPEIELLDYHDKFLILYRHESAPAYLDIAKVFRKAANKVYRILLKKSMVEKNGRFLNLVQ